MKTGERDESIVSVRKAATRLRKKQTHLPGRVRTRSSFVYYTFSVTRRLLILS